MNRFDWICYSKPPRTWRSWWELSSSQSTTLKIAEKESVSVFGACAQAQSAEMLAAQPPTTDCSAVRALKSLLQRRFDAQNPVALSFCVGEQPRWLWLLRCCWATIPREDNDGNRAEMTSKHDSFNIVNSMLSGRDEKFETFLCCCWHFWNS